MEHQEYPKALYRYGVVLIANSFDDEDRLRADGYQDWQADHDGVVSMPVVDSPVEETKEPERTYTVETSLDHNPARSKPGPKPKAK